VLTAHTRIDYGGPSDVRECARCASRVRPEQGSKIRVRPEQGSKNCELSSPGQLGASFQHAWHQSPGKSECLGKLKA
jgi:hypothetical protein